jgi:hypothetical protein
LAGKFFTRRKIDCEEEGLYLLAYGLDKALMLVFGALDQREKRA